MIHVMLYNKSMKNFFKYCWIVFLAILFLPITLAIGIYYFVCFVKEYPVYKKSFSRIVKKMKYSHKYFKSDSYKLFESLMSKSIDIDLNMNKHGFYYFVGKNAYRFGQEPLFFDVKEGQLFISFDGDPFEPIEKTFEHFPTTEKKNYLLLFEDEQIDLEANRLDLSNFDMLIIKNTIEEFADHIAQLEKQ